MKYLLELILTIIIIFFVWNMLKRMFFSTFYKFPPNKASEKPQSKQQSSKKKNIDKNLNWDAETIEFEEVKEEDYTNDKE